MSDLHGFITTSVVISDDGVNFQEDTLQDVQPSSIINDTTLTLAQQQQRTKERLEAEKQEQSKKIPIALNEEDTQFIEQQKEKNRAKYSKYLNEERKELELFHNARMKRTITADGRVIIGNIDDGIDDILDLQPTKKRFTNIDDKKLSTDHNDMYNHKPVFIAKKKTQNTSSCKDIIDENTTITNDKIIIQSLNNYTSSDSDEG